MQGGVARRVIAAASIPRVSEWRGVGEKRKLLTYYNTELHEGTGRRLARPTVPMSRPSRRGRGPRPGPQHATRPPPGDQSAWLSGLEPTEPPAAILALLAAQVAAAASGGAPRATSSWITHQQSQAPGARTRASMLRRRASAARKPAEHHAPAPPPERAGRVALVDCDVTSMSWPSVLATRLVAPACARPRARCALAEALEALQMEATERSDSLAQLVVARARPRGSRRSS